MFYNSLLNDIKESDYLEELITLCREKPVWAAHRIVRLENALNEDEQGRNDSIKKLLHEALEEQ